MHIWSTMSLESQENWRLASWLMVVGQMNSSDQNWVSLDPISYLLQFSPYENDSDRNVTLNDIPNIFHVDT